MCTGASRYQYIICTTTLNRWAARYLSRLGRIPQIMAPPKKKKAFLFFSPSSAPAQPSSKNKRAVGPLLIIIITDYTILYYIRYRSEKYYAKKRESGGGGVPRPRCHGTRGDLAFFPLRGFRRRRPVRFFFFFFVQHRCVGGWRAAGAPASGICWGGWMGVRNVEGRRGKLGIYYLFIVVGTGILHTHSVLCMPLLLRPYCTY